MGVTGQGFDQRSPLRFQERIHKFAALAASQTAQPLGPISAPGAIRNIVLDQAVAGGGTSWSAVVKKNGTTICSTEGVLAASDGNNKAVGVVGTKLAEDGIAGFATAKPAGATRPVLKTDGTQRVAVGDVITVDITLTGDYSAGNVVTGSVLVQIDPDY